MIWFSATVRIACMIEPDGLEHYMDSIHVFQAEDWTPAFERAVALGRSHETSYRNGDGQLVVWKLARIITLDRFDDGLRDGLEVCSNPIFISEAERLPFDHVFTVDEPYPTQTL